MPQALSQTDTQSSGSATVWAQGCCPCSPRLTSVHPVEQPLPGFFIWDRGLGSRQVALPHCFHRLLRIPVLTSDAAPSSPPAGDSCCQHLVSVCPGQRSALHSRLLGVSGISSCPHLAWEALYLLPHVHPMPCCLVPTTPLALLTQVSLRSAGGGVLPSGPDLRPLSRGRLTGRK